MHTGDVVHLFEGKRSNRSQTAGGRKTPGLLGRAWKRVTSFVVAAADIAREARELERKLLKQRGHHRFLDS